METTTTAHPNRGDRKTAPAIGTTRQIKEIRIGPILRELAGALVGWSPGVAICLSRPVTYCPAPRRLLQTDLCVNRIMDCVPQLEQNCGLATPAYMQQMVSEGVDRWNSTTLDG